MPQPLSKVRSKPTLGRYPDALEHHPDRAAQVGAIIAWWADVELQVGLLLAALLKTSASEAIAMLLELPNITTQINITLAAAGKALPADQFLLLEAIQEGAVEPARKARNRLIHWVWAECKELPDAVCLVDPSYILERGASFTGKFAGKTVTVEEMGYNLDRVFVYRQKDLEDLLQRIQLARHLLHNFRAFVVLKDRPGLEERYQRLSCVPEVRKALDRLIAARRKSGHQLEVT